MARGDIPAEVSNMLRWGTVTAVRATRPARVRVQTGEIETNWISWLERRAGPNGRTWHVPGIGEQVLLACPDGQIGQAVILGSVPQDEFPQPASSEDVDRTTYPDGSVVEFNHATSTLAVNVGTGKVVVTCQQAEVHASATVVLDTPTTHATGSASADGNLAAGTGASGTFTSTTGQVITVERGIVTNIF